MCKMLLQFWTEAEIKFYEMATCFGKSCKKKLQVDVTDRSDQSTPNEEESNENSISGFTFLFLSSCYGIQFNIVFNHTMHSSKSKTMQMSLLLFTRVLQRTCRVVFRAYAFKR